MKKVPRFLCVIACLLFYQLSYGQSKPVVVEGNVLDAQKSPLVGVTIAIKGKNTGTQTDPKGHYRLQIADPANVTLVFTFIGFTTHEEPLNGRTAVSVILQEDRKKLEEVVVVGYGQQKKKDVTGAISSVNSKAIQDVPVTNPQQALQGRAPGVEVINNSSKPGDEPQVRIRGSRSLNAGNDPLYVVDGIPYSGSLNDIGTGVIQSMDILKDASATAIYGSRGANGVILVTTQRGKEGKPVVSYSGSYGIVRQLGETDMMSASRFIDMRREANRTIGKYDDNNPDASDQKIFNAVEYANIKKGVDVDWQDLMISQGYQTNHGVNVSGGGENTKYSVGLGYFKDQGVLKLQNYERYNFSIALDQRIGKRVKVGASLLGAYSRRNGETYNGIDNALKMLPIAAPYDDKGKLITYPTGDNQQPNPLLDYVDGNRIELNKRLRVFTSLYGEVEIIDGLKYRLNVGPDIQSYNYGLFQGKNNTNLLIGGGDATASKNNASVVAYTIENVLTYNKIVKKHNIGVTGLYSVQRETTDMSGTNVRGIPVESQQYFNLGQALNVTGLSSSLSSWTILSYMGRVNYGFDDRYLLTLTMRADGSSRFAPGKKWGYFPSVAVGWNIINEAPLKGQTFMDNLKLRASFGRIGNTGITPYATQGSLLRIPYSFGNKGVLGYVPQDLRNPDLTWETTTSTDIGLDFGFLNGRITGVIEWYNQRTTDLLMPQTLPYSNGFNQVLMNLGTSRNRGLEIGISASIIDNPNGFSWKMDVNYSRNRSSILSLGDGRTADIGNAWFVGQPTYVYYDFKKIGIWQDKDAALAARYNVKPGEIRLEDVNGDTVIDAKNDRQILGSPQPKWQAGTTQRFSYKGFELSIVAFARWGSMIKSDFYSNYNTLFGRYNNLNVVYNTSATPSNDFPRPNANQERPSNYQSLSYFDGSFFKIRNITLAYQMPNKVVSNWGMRDLRFTVGVKQPLILAPYRQTWKGIDPEDVNVIGIDAPATWMMQFGINAKF
ncbi:TonB-linked outer membrane protein, SusC/RagA family [Chitinophaga jiangningensis]|uniref:TonB-linked outer membrane protein, SusC/RagA family n=1 Tax=Chitinophaga jiangningensis TaxID=1419482 RepID=A0A1M7A0V5_9BACT|nr:TonB-dependent receptor [Chitinophaga jiangningensis]SHL36347.1 TonB-linked outer membrane protein, SusC/RagA family [Chitinophaga jiangningensis]